MDDKIFEIPEEISNAFCAAMKRLEEEQEQYWASLSKEQQLKAFCAVSRRIFKGEIEDKGSYRHVLYGVFEFGPNAYAPAQDAGYLAIHNSIMPDNYDRQLLEAFCAKYNIEDADKKITEMFL